LILTNIYNNPENKKFQFISKSNITFQRRVLNVPGSENFMTLIGFDNNTVKNAFIWNNDCDVHETIIILKKILEGLRKKIDELPRKSAEGNSIPVSIVMVCPVKGSTRFPVGYSECIGRRPTMEDQIVILGMGPRIRETEDYFAIFDGHGGSYVAEHCA